MSSFSGFSGCPALVVNDRYLAPVIDGRCPASVVEGRSQEQVIDGRCPARVVDGRRTAPVVDGRCLAPVIDGRSSAPVVDGRWLALRQFCWLPGTITVILLSLWMVHSLHSVHTNPYLSPLIAM